MNKTRAARLLVGLLLSVFVLTSCLNKVIDGMDSIFEKPKVRLPSESGSTPPAEPAQGERKTAASPSKPAPAAFAGIVSAHNAWRAKVGVGPLVWSDDLAQYAQSWADRLAANGCDMQHRPGNQYGENLAWASGKRMTPEEVVAMWGAEGRDYDYKANKCAPGRICGHYTQVVWKDSQRVGCGMARCGDQEIWVCNYDPPGNYVGRKPY